MSEAGHDHYDDALVALYDHSPLLSVERDHPSVDWFRRQADRYGGPVLQIGVATGNFALPILRDGHEVVGVDISAEMLDVVRRRAETESVEVGKRLTTVIGDMRTLALDQTFPLIIMPGNVFLYNVNQRDQLATLGRMRAHLGPGGVLALDVFAMDPALLAEAHPRQTTVRFATPDGTQYLAEQTVAIDPLRQLEKFRMVHRRLGPDGRLDPGIYSELTMRYVFPPELMLLLRVAGLRIRQFGGSYTQDGPKRTYTGPQLVVAEKGGDR